MQQKAVAIVVPHPDDLEILAGHITQYFVQKNYQVYEILMTGGEYGVVNRFKNGANQIKGKKLQQMRKRENTQAKKYYGISEEGIPKVKTIRMNYIDGFVPYSHKSINRLNETLQKISPEIIIGPDPVFSIDWHVDHMATARNTYSAIKKNITNSKFRSWTPKKFFVYQSFKYNRWFPMQSWDILQAGCLEHKSQMTPFVIKMMFWTMKKVIFPLKRNRMGIREINLKEMENTSKAAGKIQTLREKIIYSILSPSIPDNSTYSPHPEKLGLIIDPKDVISLND